MGQPVDDVHILSNKTVKERSNEDKYGFDWVELLSNVGFVTPSITSFRHVPLSDTWTKDVSIGMKLEVENTDARTEDPQCYWLASVISLMGYKARIRYEGFDDDDSKDFWINLGAEDVYPIGWCAANKKLLIPPLTIQGKFTEWCKFIMERLTGRTSLPFDNFHSRVLEASKSRFVVGMTLELVDHHDLSAIRVATVEKIIGRRLKLRYSDASTSDTDSWDSIFWCHEESTLIHPVGWALSVGHKIDASPAYLERCSKRHFLPSDAIEEMFNQIKPASQSQLRLKFKEGMKLEAVDPICCDKITVATVVKVLRDDYIMIRIDRKPEEDSTTFCIHATSACIAPPGFCHANGISLQPPVDCKGDCFLWDDYLRQQKAVAAPEALFQSPMTTTVPKFRAGMHVEAAELVDSRLVCVATVAKVAGRLVRIHFDGWPDDFDQWMDAASPEIYPVGWCELVGHRLEAPKAAAPSPTKKMKKKTKTSWKTGTWKKRSASKSSKNASGSSKRHKASKSSQDTSEEVDDGGEKDADFNKVDIAAAGEVGKKIPKLIELSNDQRKEALAGVDIANWSPTDVAEFLRVNGLAVYSDTFIKEMVDGPMMLSMTQDRILPLAGMEEESSLKILDLIRQLELLKMNGSGSVRPAL